MSINAIQIVTIKTKIPLFKEDDKAERIEGIVLRDENHNFSCKFMNNIYDSTK